MTVSYKFSQSVPSWTKLGSAEFFRLLEYPLTNETAIRKKAIEMGIKWNLGEPSIEGDRNETINDFLTFVANWYTKNKLTMVSNYDLVIKKGENGGETLKPVPRPATLRYIPSNVSNIKPRSVKELKLDELPDSVRQKFAEIKANGIEGIPPEKFKASKIYPKERYMEFTVISSSGKKGRCFGCSTDDFLMKTKETQYPLTVGLENYANFYSYHSGPVGFCRTCAISNHLAFGRVLYNVSTEKISGKMISTVFLAVPQANSIKELIDFFGIIDLSYPIVDFIRKMNSNNNASNILISSGIGGFTNFVEKRFGNSGFYFLILVLFSALSNTIDVLVHHFKDDQMKESVEDSEIMHLFFPKDLSEDEATGKISDVLFRSWEFILSRGDQHLRYWKYQHSKQVIGLLSSLKEECHVPNVLSITQKLIHKSGNNYLDIWREDFSRSILLGKPDIGILEKAVWEKMVSGESIWSDIASLGKCLVRKVLKVNEMEKDDILKQCSLIGKTIAELSAEDSNKGMLYELRSVGNAQALRSFIERFTFKSVLMEKTTSITNDFLSRLYSGEDWQVYKSTIAIIANQQFSYLSAKKKEVSA